ncbi:MAG: hypothetical protein ABI831_16875 [Betaproteobacteria bacterium]
MRFRHHAAARHEPALKLRQRYGARPAFALVPCGVDHHRMRFGLQVVGRFGGDVELLDAAGGLERAFEGIADLSRPLPDISALATPRPELKSIVTDPPSMA